MESDEGTPINILSLPAAMTAGAASPATAAAAPPAVIFSALRRDTGPMVATGFSSPLNVISAPLLLRVVDNARWCRAFCMLDVQSQQTLSRAEPGLKSIAGKNISSQEKRGPRVMERLQQNGR